MLRGRRSPRILGNIVRLFHAQQTSFSSDGLNLWKLIISFFVLLFPFFLTPVHLRAFISGGWSFFFNFKIHLYFYTSTAVYFVLAFIVMASDELASNNFSKTIRFFYYSYREWGFIIEIINWWEAWQCSSSSSSCFLLKAMIIDARVHSIGYYVVYTCWICYLEMLNVAPGTCLFYQYSPEQRFLHYSIAWTAKSVYIYSSSDFDSEHDRFHRLRRDKIDNVDRSDSCAWQCSWYALHRQSQWFLRCVDFAFHLIVRGPASIILSEVHQRENGKF